MQNKDQGRQSIVLCEFTAESYKHLCQINTPGYRLLLLRCGAGGGGDSAPEPILKMVLNHLNRSVYDACNFFFEKKYIGGLHG